jgi:hypothetical protein
MVTCSTLPAKNSDDEGGAVVLRVLDAPAMALARDVGQIDAQKGRQQGSEQDY